MKRVVGAVLVVLTLAGCTGLTVADEVWTGVAGDRCSASSSKGCRR